MALNFTAELAFHRFRQAKIAYRVEPIFATAPAASKNDAHFKSGQNGL